MLNILNILLSNNSAYTVTRKKN